MCSLCFTENSLPNPESPEVQCYFTMQYKPKIPGACCRKWTNRLTTRVEGLWECTYIVPLALGQSWLLKGATLYPQVSQEKLGMLYLQRNSL